MDVPNGLDELKATFGNIDRYIRSDGTLDPTWEYVSMDHAQLPFPLPLDWQRSVTVEKIWCHKLMVPVFEAVFQQIVDRGLQDRVRTYAGCFAYRTQRGSSKLSTHAWGVAIDLNAYQNQQGTLGSMDGQLVELFEDAGFVWGGTFGGLRQDPMHYEFCKNY